MAAHSFILSIRGAMDHLGAYVLRWGAQTEQPLFRVYSHRVDAGRKSVAYYSISTVDEILKFSACPFMLKCCRFFPLTSMGMSKSAILCFDVDFAVETLLICMKIYDCGF